MNSFALFALALMVSTLVYILLPIHLMFESGSPVFLNIFTAYNIAETFVYISPLCIASFIEAKRKTKKESLKAVSYAIFAAICIHYALKQEYDSAGNILWMAEDRFVIVASLIIFPLSSVLLAQKTKK